MAFRSWGIPVPGSSSPSARISWSVWCVYPCHCAGSAVCISECLWSRRSFFTIHWVIWSLMVLCTSLMVISSLKTALTSDLEGGCQPLSISYSGYTTHPIWSRDRWPVTNINHITYLYSCLFHKLDVDEVRLCPIRLPKCIDVIIPYLLYSIARLGWTQCPHSLISNLSACSIGRRSHSLVDERLSLDHYLNAITVLLKSIKILWMEIDIESIEASMDNLRQRRYQQTSSIDVSKGRDPSMVYCRHTNRNTI